MTDAELLDQHRHGSRDAFAQLVQRHIDWAYSVARRRVRDEHLAEDVTQAAFMTLARKPPRLRAGSPLSPWLLKVIILTCKATLRNESNRRRRETEAAKMRSEAIESSESAKWNELSLYVDGFVQRLNTADRSAIMLRFYEQKSLAEVGLAMSISEEAARKRVSRAIEKLRSLVAQHDATVSSAVITQFLLNEATKPAPSSLLDSIIRNPLPRVTIHRRLWLLPAVAVPLIVAGVIVLLQPAEKAKPSGSAGQDDIQPSTQAAAVLTKDQIAAAVRRQREKIRNFSVAFCFDDVTPPDQETDQLVMREHLDFVFKGEKFFIDEQRSTGRNATGFFAVQNAFDGHRSVQFIPRQRTASVQDQFNMTTLSFVHGFFGAAMLSPAGTKFDLDLLTILDSGTTTLRSGLESIGDRACYVLEAAPHSNEKDTIWLDPERGFAPLRIAIMYDGNPNPRIEFHIDQLAEITGGLWLPVEATKIVVDNEGGKSARLTSVMKVDSDPDGKPAIKISSDIPDSRFSLLDQLPPGTTVFDSNARRYWIVEAKK